MKKLLFILPFILFLTGISNAEPIDSSLSKKIDTSVVTGERTLEKKAYNEKWGVFGDYIEVNVKNISHLIAGVAQGRKDSIILFLNNFPLEDIHPHMVAIDSVKNTGTIVFHLNRKSRSLDKMKPYFRSFTGFMKPALSVGVKGKAPIKTDITITLYYINKTFIFVTFGIMLLVLAMMLFFSKKFHLLQTGDTKNSPYSLAQVQLAFWTILVSFSFIYLWIVNGEMPDLPTSILILIGISIGTKGVASYIDYTKKPGQLSTPETKGFLKDILSDDNGINIQRAQMVIWTLILGCIYVRSFMVDLFIPDFDANILSLMGISSGTYALLKTIETRGTLPVETKDAPNDSGKKDDNTKKGK